MGKNDDITWMQKGKQGTGGVFVKDNTLVIQFNQDVKIINRCYLDQRAGDHLLESRNVKNIIFDFSRVTFYG